ncbi:hypothetical protein V1506DRAFT_521936 [Lipomyces tetrasporus]
MDDFNSSDIEFEPPVNNRSGTQPGRASIAQIIENADSDRLTSKRAFKQLQFGHGPPGTRTQQELWVARFNAFRTHSLKKSLSVPFSGEDIVRFFDSIIGRLAPAGRGKPAINDDVVINAFPHHFSLRNFHTFIDNAVRAGRLMRGLWNRRVWLNFMTVSRMGRAWLEHHHNHGTVNWDITLARLMSVVLVTSLGCRAGDAARSQFYEGTEFMQYRHVELQLEGEPKLENLRARFTIEFSKGSKDKKNDDFDLYLRPLDDSRYPHMCIVSLLLIHALRHGLVVGSSILDVLEHAANTADGRVIWTFPDRPVLCAITSTGVRRCDLDRPARTSQLLDSVKQMGLVSNILTRVYVHATRLGAAQDVAHLPQAEGLGFATNEVRQSLGHHNSAFQRGITEAYAGSPTREFYNDRAKREFVHRWGAQFSEQSALEFVKKPITEEEIRGWQDRNEPLEEDRNSKKARKRAQNNIRQERHEEFIKTAKPDARTTSNASNAAAAIPLSQKSASEVNVISSFVTSYQERQVREETRSTGSSMCPDFDNQSAIAVSAIDPRLVDSDVLNEAGIDTHELDRLSSQLFFKATSHGSDRQQTDFDSAALFEEELMESGSADKVQIAASEFVSAYANINVVDNIAFAKAWPSYVNGKTSFAEGIGRHSVRGNSRDDPKPLEFYCRKTPMCRYRSIRRDAMAEHERICNQTVVATSIAKQEAAANGSCDWDGCV